MMNKYNDAVSLPLLQSSESSQNDDVGRSVHDPRSAVLALVASLFAVTACDPQAEVSGLEESHEGEHGLDSPVEFGAEEDERILFELAEERNDDDDGDAAQADLADAPRAQASPANPVHVNHAVGQIPHGGSAFEEARVYHVRGSMCSAGHVRAGYVADHQGNGWGGFDRWLSPGDLTDCRAVFWTRNPAGFMNGILFWAIEEERADPGHWDYCGVFGPCGDGEGDCDVDSDCAAGLACEHDVGGEYGFASGVDVCTPTLPPGHWDYCSVLGPCEIGEGDCDGNAQCAPPFTCGNNNGPQFGMASWVDVCH